MKYLKHWNEDKDKSKISNVRLSFISKEEKKTYSDKNWENSQPKTCLEGNVKRGSSRIRKWYTSNSVPYKERKHIREATKER